MLQVGCTCGCSVHMWPCPWAVNPNPPVFAMRGWVCPVCNGGVSPFAAKCPCVLVAHPPYYVGTGLPGVTWILPPSTCEPVSSPTISIESMGPTCLALN